MPKDNTKQETRTAIPDDPDWEGMCRVVAYDKKTEKEEQNKLINYKRHDDRVWFSTLVMWAMSHNHVVEIEPVKAQ